MPKKIGLSANPTSSTWSNRLVKPSNAANTFKRKEKIKFLSEEGRVKILYPTWLSRGLMYTPNSTTSGLTFQREKLGEESPKALLVEKAPPKRCLEIPDIRGCLNGFRCDSRDLSEKNFGHVKRHAYQTDRSDEWILWDASQQDTQCATSIDGASKGGR